MKFFIEENTTKTEEQKMNGSLLSLKPFESKITGLAIWLYGSNGVNKRQIISDTNNPFKINVSEFISAELEYSFTDKQYIVEFILS